LEQKRGIIIPLLLSALGRQINLNAMPDSIGHLLKLFKNDLQNQRPARQDALQNKRWIWFLFQKWNCVEDSQTSRKVFTNRQKLER
jgi:hypothetical protein